MFTIADRGGRVQAGFGRERGTFVQLPETYVILMMMTEKDVFWERQYPKNDAEGVKDELDEVECSAGNGCSAGF